MTPFYVVIPARFASSRLPGKPLLEIAGKPMVVHVALQAAASMAQQCVVATDHMPIVHAANAHGFQAVMTRQDHASGTDRIAEVAALMGWSAETIVVNVQGDEPLIEPALINAVAHTLAQDPTAVMATACHPLHDAESFANPNVVKVVLNAKQQAVYFSRAMVPFPRDTQSQPPTQAFRHIGIYAYRVGFLNTYAQLPVSPLETIECLEQLRVLYHGYTIAVTQTLEAPAGGVDTPEDLARVRAHFAAKAM